MTITAQSELTLQNDSKGTLLKRVDIALDFSPEVDKSYFFQSPGELNREGVELLTQALIHGLAATIKGAHDSGTWDRVAHLQYIVDELERACTAKSRNINLSRN